MDASRRSVLSLGLAGLGLGLSACGAGRATPASSSSSAASAPAVRPLVLGAPGRPLTRTPALAWDTESLRLIAQVLEPLLGVDQDTGAPTPLLAEHRESEDGLTHTFVLTPDLRFSDGVACDADAVVANLRRWSEGEPAEAVAMPSPFVAAFGGLAGEDSTAFRDATAADARTVRLRLRRRLRHLPAALASPRFAISSPASWKRTQDVDGAPVATPAGTGPHRWADPTESVEVLEPLGGTGPATVLVPNEHARAGLPTPPTAVVHSWGRASTRLRELRRGNADVIDVVAPGQLRPLVEAGTQVLPRDPFSVLYLGMNLDHPLLHSLYLRQAVAYAVDRPRLASSDVFLQGTALAHDLVPPALGVAVEDGPRYDVDPARARRLLELAGYRGEPLEFLYPSGHAWPSLPEPERVFAMVSSDLGVVGLRVVPVPVPADQDYRRAVLGRRGRALHLMGRDGHYRDPHAFLEPFARSARTETGYVNAALTADVDAAASETDDERRRELHRRAGRTLLLDLPALPLVHPISALATGPRVASYPTSPQLDEPLAQVRLADS
ncbi:ABC transporter substrate-binding protein [Micrococcus porci]|uniref:ABC transporter substrate-binding protein n=1 Tax=Micrococcus porci TaxID=2856555 RepID=UPI001CCA4806|nr:ABC transporter substrate-binding protein [Micrococcus porci]UBH24205.1 ABC transporter substrate-binding protein [Micrococcus porci]